MNGNAPNSPATGSQLLVPQKPSPNFCIDSVESFASVTAIATTISSSAAANAPTPTRNVKSDDRTCLGNLYAFQCRLFEHRHVGGQRSVTQIRGVLLAVGERPSHEVDHRLAGGFVFGVLVEEQPRKGRNRIGAGSLGVRDRDAEVGWDVWRGYVCRFRHGVHRCLDEFTCGVLD